MGLFVSCCYDNQDRGFFPLCLFPRAGNSCCASVSTHTLAHSQIQMHTFIFTMHPSIGRKVLTDNITCFSLSQHTQTDSACNRKIYWMWQLMLRSVSHVSLALPPLTHLCWCVYKTWSDRDRMNEANLIMHKYTYICRDTQWTNTHSR